MRYCISAFLLITGLALSCTSVRAQSHGFSASQQSNMAASAQVRLRFTNREDPNGYEAHADVGYDGPLSLQAGLSLVLEWEGQPTYYYDGTDQEGFSEPDALSVCTDYDDANDACLSTWESISQYGNTSVSLPAVSGDAVEEKFIAFKVEGGGWAIDYYNDQYPLYGTDIEVMPYLLVPEPDAYYTDSNGNAIGVWWQRSESVSQGNLNNPLLIAEGIDLGDDTLPYTNYARFKGLAYQLRHEGVDIAIISFGSPLSSIRVHESGMRRAVRFIHSLKQNQSIPTAVAGLSRGGVVARYALAHMEEDNIPHNTSLYLSYDAPHRGANINLNLQEDLILGGEYSDEVPSDVKANFRSAAVKELLIEHAEHSQPVTEHESFYNELNNLNGGYGYPQQSRNVAWSNGSWSWPNFDTNLAFELTITNFPDVEFPLTTLDQRPGSYIPQYLTFSAYGNVAVASYLDLLFLVGDFLTFGLWDPPSYYSFERRSDPTFIPTTSALDKDSEFSSTKFDHAENALTRSSHAAFSQEAANFVLQEIRGAFGPGDIPSTLTFQNETLSGTHTFTASNSIDVGPNVLIASNSNITFEAGSSITFGPGFKAETGSAFLAQVGAIGTNTNASYSQAAVAASHTSQVNSPGHTTEEEAYLGSENASEARKNRTGAVEEKIPAEFNLSGNYPNPFSGHTSLTYKLPVSTHVKIEVYDLLGRNIATLIDRPERAGVHRAQWDASGFASGTYIIKIEAGSYEAAVTAVLAN